MAHFLVQIAAVYAQQLRSPGTIAACPRQGFEPLTPRPSGQPDQPILCAPIDAGFRDHIIHRYVVRLRMQAGHACQFMRAGDELVKFSRIIFNFPTTLRMA